MPAWEYILLLLLLLFIIILHTPCTHIEHTIQHIHWNPVQHVSSYIHFILDGAIKGQESPRQNILRTAKELNYFCEKHNFSANFCISFHFWTTFHFEKFQDCFTVGGSPHVQSIFCPDTFLVVKIFLGCKNCRNENIQPRQEYCGRRTECRLGVRFAVLAAPGGRDFSSFEFFDQT